MMAQYALRKKSVIVHHFGKKEVIKWFINKTMFQMI